MDIERRLQRGDSQVQPTPKMLGQTSLEFLLMVGIGLAIVMSAFFIASSYSADSVRHAQALDAAERISHAAAEVRAMGQNSREYVDAELPDGVIAIEASGSRLVVTFSSNSGDSQVWGDTGGETILSVPAVPGKARLLVQSLPSGRVLVGQAGLQCSPQSIAISANPGTSGAASFTVFNSLPTDADAVASSLNGSAAAMLQNPLLQKNMSQGDSQTVQIQYSVPANQPSGEYGGEIVVTSDSGTCASQVLLQVNGQANCAELCASQGYASGTCRSGMAACVVAKEDYRQQFGQSCTVQPNVACCCSPTMDLAGPVVSSMWTTPSNASVYDNVTFSAVCDDTSSGGSFITLGQSRLDGGAWQGMNGANGTYNSSVSLQMNSSLGIIPMNGQHVVEARCTDTANNTGAIAEYNFSVVAGDVLGPLVLNLSATWNGSITGTVNITGHGSETLTGGSNVSYCRVAIDPIVTNPNPNDSIFIPATPSDGSFNSQEEDFYYPVSGLEAKWHTAMAYCSDSRNNTGGMFNYSFGVNNSDVILLVETSSYMNNLSLYSANGTAFNATGASFPAQAQEKIALPSFGINNATIALQYRSSVGATCVAYFEARVGAAVVAYGNTTSTLTTYAQASLANLSQYYSPSTLDLYVRANGTSCAGQYAEVRNFNLSMQNIEHAKWAAKQFVSSMDTSAQGGLGYFNNISGISGTAGQLHLMDAANKTALQNAIGALAVSTNSSQCLDCGINSSIAELNSTRGRYGVGNSSVRAIVVFTNDQNAHNSYNGSSFALSNHTKIYPFAYGGGIDEIGLRGVSDMTGGAYNYQPDNNTILYVFTHLGQ